MCGSEYFILLMAANSKMTDDEVGLYWNLKTKYLIKQDTNAVLSVYVYISVVKINVKFD